MNDRPSTALLLTGSTGFLGSALTNCFTKDEQYKLTVVIRQALQKSVTGYESIVVGDIKEVTDWKPIVSGIDVVIHAAARVHIMSDSSVDSMADFHKVNTLATLTLAHQSAKAGVKRFLFISTIKVNGEETFFADEFQPAAEKQGIRCFTEESVIFAKDPYSLSKQQAENGLLQIAQETDMEVVIIRPALIYGPGVKANFASMMKWVNKRVPLPLGSVNNRRSFLAIDNLVDFITVCIDHPKAANEIFLLSDGEDVSTPELLRKVADAFGKKILLLPVPVNFMRRVAKWINKEAMVNRLLGSLQVDNSKAKALLGWKPVITMDEQLKKTVEAAFK